MAYSVTLLGDHKGYTRSRVNGAEYVVDAAIDITSYTGGGETITASSLGLSTITAVSITGQETTTVFSHIEVSSSGAYTSDSSFQIKVTNLVDGIEPTPESIAEGSGDLGVFRVRVFGNL